MSSKLDGQRLALTVTPYGVVWQVRDFQWSNRVFEGQGLLVPVGEMEFQWRMLEALSHPLIATVKVVGTQVWVQFEPPHRRLNGQVVGDNVTSNLLQKLFGDVGITNCGCTLAGRVLSVTGFPLLLVCVPAIFAESLGWELLGRLVPGFETGPKPLGKENGWLVSETGGSRAEPCASKTGTPKWVPLKTPVELRIPNRSDNYSAMKNVAHNVEMECEDSEKCDKTLQFAVFGHPLVRGKKRLLKIGMWLLHLRLRCHWWRHQRK